jgi:hypothetical protein
MICSESCSGSAETIQDFMQPSRTITALDGRWYPGFAGYRDHETFRRRIFDRLDTSMIVRDLVAGAGIVRQMDCRSLADRVCGVNPDPLLDELDFHRKTMRLRPVCGSTRPFG